MQIIKSRLERGTLEALSHLELYQRDDILELSRIEISEDSRNLGHGTGIMAEICEYADKNGLTIALTPDDAFGGNKTRLIQFYKRFGFVRNSGKNKDFRTRESYLRIPLAG